MFLHRMRFPFYLCLGLLVATMGCGEPKPLLVPLQGTVKYKGEAITAGSIHFHPSTENEFSKDTPSSLLQLDGSFAAKTFPFGDGITVGTYKVTLSPSLASRLKKPNLAKPESTPWSITVPESGILGHEFVVE